MAGISWTADGREIVYAAGSVGSTHLWRVPVSGGGLPAPAHALQFAILPAIARTGHRLVYTWRIANCEPVADGYPYQRTQDAHWFDLWSSSPQYSPDSRKIAFQSNRSGNMEVWTCDADGANCQQLTFFGGPECGSPRWSPDGQWLALDSRTEGQSEIYVIAADGGPLRRITDHPADDFVPTGRGMAGGSTSPRSVAGDTSCGRCRKRVAHAVQVTRSGGWMHSSPRMAGTFTT